jgi:hypothetical protein
MPTMTNSSSLKEIPAELRALIGHQVMKGPGAIFFKHGYHKSLENHHRRGKSCAWTIEDERVLQHFKDCLRALQIDRGLRSEWSPIFYRETEIKLDADPYVLMCFTGLLPRARPWSLVHNFRPRTVVLEVGEHVTKAGLLDLLLGGRTKPWKRQILPWNRQGRFTVKLSTSDTVYEDAWWTATDPLGYCREHMQASFAAAEELRRKGRLTSYRASAKVKYEYSHGDRTCDADGKCSHCTSVGCELDSHVKVTSIRDCPCRCPDCISRLLIYSLTLELRFVEHRSLKR